VYGDYRLKSSYQPIFAPRDGLLFPVAVEGLISPQLAGQPVPSALFFGEVPPEDGLFIESMCRALHLRNHHNIGVEDLELFFNYDPCANRDLVKSLNEIAFMARRLKEISLAPHLLTCEINESAARDVDVLVRLVAEMRSHGIRIAIDDFGAGHSTLERFSVLQPEIVKLDGARFRKLAAHREAERLLGLAVRGFRAAGAQVLIEGIETTQQLAVALAAGADLLQGYLLGLPALVGTIFDTAPRSVAELLAADRKVIPLFG
jgi:EAL domain-containing protein (putative c-di-GMP-specific phosphodiesterase class I)